MSGLYPDNRTEAPVLDNLDADTKAMKELKAKLQAVADAATEDSDPANRSQPSSAPALVRDELPSRRPQLRSSSSITTRAIVV